MIIKNDLSEISVSSLVALLIVSVLMIGCGSKEEVHSENSFQDWVKSELKTGKQTIVLPKGTHHIYAADTGARILHLSNNDDGLKSILFDLSNRENLVIDGNGAELIMHGYVMPFYFKNAKNITIKNIIIDWAHPFFAQAEVIEVEKDNFTVKFQKEYPATVKDGKVVFLNPDLPYPVSFNNINFFNAELDRLVFKSWDEYGVGYDHNAEVLEDNVIKIHSTNIKSPIKRGHIAVFQYEGRTSPAIVSHKSSNIYLNNITEYHAGGIANLFEGSTNIYIDSMQIVRRPDSGRFFTAHHDATHYVDCRGDIHLKNSKFELQGDDDFNIHGIYRPVARKVSNNQLFVKLMHFQQMGVETLFSGDNIGFYNAKTLEYLGEGKLEKVLQRENQVSILFFEKALPKLDWDNVVVALREYDVDVQISGNHFSKHRARGLLIKTLGKVRVFDNYFNVQGAAIKIANDATGWYEAGPVEDVEIYNNIFDQCNSGGFSQATFEISPAITNKQSPVPVFKNIKIHNNKIIQIFKPLIIASHTENLEFYDNEIVIGKDYGFWWKGKNEPKNIIKGAGLINSTFQEMKH